MIRYSNTNKSSITSKTLRRRNIQFKKLLNARIRANNRPVLQCNISNIVSGSENRPEPQTLAYDVHNVNTSYLSEENVSDEFEEFSDIAELSSEDDNVDHHSCDEVIEKHGFHYFQNELARVFVEAKITHSQGDKILSVLNTHPCFKILPLSMKTLLKTPRKPIQTIKMGSGEYYHVGLAKEISLKLNNFNDISVDHLILDLHTDGMSAHHSTSTQIWPIQFKISNILDQKPAIIGVYIGSKKPSDPMEYFKYLIEEFKSIKEVGGIRHQGKFLKVLFRGLIADAPARALILNHKGRNARNPCSKCKTSGESFQKTMCFLQTNNVPRTYEEYYNATDHNHHLPTGDSSKIFRH